LYDRLECITTVYYIRREEIRRDMQDVDYLCCRANIEE
jgi:hypothetical protein